MNKELLRGLEQAGSVILQAPLKQYTTFKTGGPAEVLFEPSSEENAGKAVGLCREAGVPLTVIGGGSNLLVSDKGLSGVVMRFAVPRGQEWNLPRDGGLVYAPAAMRKCDFVDWAIANNHSGVQFMVYVPGCLGGGLVMNAGTYMGNFIDIVRRIRYVDTNGQQRELQVTREIAGYRGMQIPDMQVILGAWYELPRCEDPVRLQAEVKAIIRDRQIKHPWGFPSAGSVFKNPEGHQSWKLVNDAGLKGFRIGGAMVSELHTNFIINVGWASSTDILRLIRHIQNTVSQKFNVDLHTEVRVLGDFSDC